jgi:NhaP-type Na+/H+ or K+/H+ antiporter
MADQDRKVDIGTKVVSAVAAMAAAFVARKLITFVWTKAVGKEPPTHPEDPQVALSEALGWAALTGVGVEAARLLATRAAARRAYSGPDCEPATAAKG